MLRLQSQHLRMNVLSNRLASTEDILQLGQYVEHRRLMLLDNVFWVYLDHMELKKMPVAIKRIIYRYFFLVFYIFVGFQLFHSIFFLCFAICS